MVDKWDNRAAVTIPTRIKRGLIVHHCALNKRDPNRSRGLPVSAGYLAHEILILRRDQTGVRIGRTSSTALKEHMGDVEILARSIIEKGPQEAWEAAD
jgi:hypothetical protein